MKWITGVFTMWMAAAVVFAAETPKTGQVSGKVVILRAKPSRQSEILARLTEGTTVEIREKIELQTPRPGEPAAWYRIGLAPHAKVWVHSLFVDDATKTVKPNRLNLRAGPGENYTILGRLNKGASIETVATKGDWIQIATPPDAYAFIAANLVKTEVVEEPKTELEKPEKPEKPATEKAEEITKVDVPQDKKDEADLPVAAKTTPPPTPPALPESEKPATPVEAVTPPATEPEQPVVQPRRVVTREGIVRRNLNINSPSGYDLEDVRNGKHLNYLFSEDPNLGLKKYLNKRVIVVGEEKMDYRWKRVPVLDIESLEVLE